jgi:hypothetical protein
MRQTGIDEELFDVISGFEALGGPAKKPRVPVSERIEVSARRSG